MCQITMCLRGIYGNIVTLDMTATNRSSEVAAVTNALSLPYPITRRIVGFVIL